MWDNSRVKAIAALEKFMKIGNDGVPLGQGHLMGLTYFQALRAKRFLESGISLGDATLAKSSPPSQPNKSAAEVRELVS